MAGPTKRGSTILTSVTASVVTAVIVVWLSEAFHQVAPSPQRTWLAIQNALSDSSFQDETGFRIVLCWLENDRNGENTRRVEDAFAGFEGIALRVSATEVGASGAADEWRPAIRKRALAVLDEWNADLAIVGNVKRSSEAVALWFVPRQGDGTLSRADRPYSLEAGALGGDFYEDVQTQLAVTAWNTVVAFTRTPAGGFLEGLRAATTKLADLLDSPTIGRPEHRAVLYAALGDALRTLGGRDPGSGDLERGEAALRNALAIWTRRNSPLKWARAQYSLGIVLRELADRGSEKERLEQALAANLAALEVFSRERMPFEWAAVQGHVGVVLRHLGTLETGLERVEQAVALHRAALAVFTREQTPVDWAMEQDHLGNALSLMGERQKNPELLKQAISAHNAALVVFTREETPTNWATAHTNLGLTLTALDRSEQDIASLEQSLEAFRAALQVRTREKAPLVWAMTQSGLGGALVRLGERKGDRGLLVQGRDAYVAALEVLGSEGASRHRKMVQANLDEVSRQLRETVQTDAPAGR